MSSPDDQKTLETELKFEIAASALERLRAHPALAVPARVDRLRSVYFDTSGHDLRNAGVSLRVRESGGRFVQTVKSRDGAALIKRNEWEATVEADRPDPEALARTPVGEVLNSCAAPELTPVFSTIVQRAVRLWRDADVLVELSLDEGEIDAGGDREPIRELELELKSGTPSALFDLADDLARMAPMRLSFDSKAERGYRLAGHDASAALKAEPPDVCARTPAAEAFRRVARSCLTQVAGNAQFLRRVRSSRALHQMRVGLRRLRAAMTAFKPMISDARLAEIMAEASWLAGELDQARDLDVFAQSVLPHDEEEVRDPALAAFHKLLLDAQAKAYDRALAALDSPRFGRFLLEAARWVETGDWSRDPGGEALRAQPLREFGAEALSRLHRRVRKAGRHFDHLDARGRHRLRIQVKKLRYAVEFFGVAFGKAPDRRRRFSAALRDLQERLGGLNDLAVSSDIALEVAGRRACDAAFAAGVLIGGRRHDEPRLLAEAAGAFSDFAALRRFWPKP